MSLQATLRWSVSIATTSCGPAAQALEAIFHSGKRLYEYAERWMGRHHADCERVEGRSGPALSAAYHECYLPAIGPRLEPALGRTL